MLAPEAQGSNILRLPRCLSSLDQSPDLMLSSIGQQGFPLPSLSPFRLAVYHDLICFRPILLSSFLSLRVF